MRWADQELRRLPRAVPPEATTAFESHAARTIRKGRVSDSSPSLGGRATGRLRRRQTVARYTAAPFDFDLSMRPSSATLLVILAIAAQACGWRGPLYLPEPAKAVEPVSSDQAESDAEKKKAEQRAKESSSPAPIGEAPR